MSEKYIPRLSVEITQEQFDALIKYIPWGIKKKLFSVIVDDLIEMLKVDPSRVIGLVVSGRAKFSLEERTLEESPPKEKKEKTK